MMAASTLEQMIQAIKHADEKSNLAEIFVSIPENTIWSNAKSIFDDLELKDFGPTLLQSIDEVFASICDRDSACDLLLHILTSTADKLTYQAAQHVILHNPEILTNKFVRHSSILFEPTY